MAWKLVQEQWCSSGCRILRQDPHNSDDSFASEQDSVLRKYCTQTQVIIHFLLFEFVRQFLTITLHWILIAMHNTEIQTTDSSLITLYNYLKEPSRDSKLLQFQLQWITDWVKNRIVMKLHNHTITCLTQHNNIPDDKQQSNEAGNNEPLQKQHSAAI